MRILRVLPCVSQGHRRAQTGLAVATTSAVLGGVRKGAVHHRRVMLGLQTQLLSQFQNDLVLAGLRQLQLALQPRNLLLELTPSHEQVLDLSGLVVNHAL